LWLAEGTSIFKEMVQNADDAGATEVNLCLDYRQHASSGLAYEKLASFQGLGETSNLSSTCQC
jgi:sacsin